MILTQKINKKETEYQNSVSEEEDDDKLLIKTNLQLFRLAQLLHARLVVLTQEFAICSHNGGI